MTTPTSPAIAEKVARLTPEQREFVVEVIDRVIATGETAEAAIEFVTARREFAALASWTP